jgi:hypothetical protein
MPDTFPLLRTNAVMQYPATREFSFADTIIYFVDGSQQCYRESAGPLRRWLIRLDLLDETEIASLESFFGANQGCYASFSFTDPWDSTEFPDCSIDQDSFEFMLSGEGRAQTALIVKQNRS